MAVTGGTAAAEPAAVELVALALTGCLGVLRLRTGERATSFGEADGMRPTRWPTRQARIWCAAINVANQRRSRWALTGVEAIDHRHARGARASPKQRLPSKQPRAPARYRAKAWGLFR